MSLSGEKGSGKSLVMKSVTKELKTYTPIYGKCTPITQITPGGVIQDILLNIFNLPNFCLDNPDFKKNASQYFKNEFPELNNNEIFDLINFLYPTKEGTFEGIVKAKNKTFLILNKIFDIMTLPGKFIFIIDNFDFIDGFSYEFLSNFIRKENVWKNLKLVLLYSEAKPAKGYFYFPTNKNDSIYLDITIAPLEYKQTGALVKQKIKKIKDFPSISSAELQEMYKISNGNPSYINHALCLKYDCELCGQEFELSTNFRGLLEHRLALLSHLNPIAYNILISSAIIGDKINVNLIKEIFNIDNFELFDAKRTIVYVNKVKHTDKKYPRGNGKERKNPL